MFIGPAEVEVGPESFRSKLEYLASLLNLRVILVRMVIEPGEVDADHGVERIELLGAF